MCHSERYVEDYWLVHRLEVCVGWVRGQVQLLPVWQVIEVRGTEAHTVECFCKLRGGQGAPVEHLFECPSAEVQLVLDPLRWE